MRKLIIFILSVLALTLIISGCGGGSGGGGNKNGSDSGQSTYNLHFQDEDGNPIEGVIVHYKDTAGQSYNTDASDKKGNSIVIFKKSDKYPIDSAIVAGKTVPVTGFNFDVSSDDIKNNITKNFPVEFNSKTGAVRSIQEAFYIIHFQDQTGAAIVGAVLNYKDYLSKPYNSDATGTDGNTTINFDQDGTYPIVSVTLSDNSIVPAPTDPTKIAKFIVSIDDVSNNITKKVLVKIDTTTNPPSLISYEEVK
jgi:hypothetical protein